MPPRTPTVVLGRSRENWIAAGTIGAVSIVAVAGAWATAPIRQAQLNEAQTPYSAPQQAPAVAAQYAIGWQAPADSFNSKPVIADGLVISADTTGDTGAQTTITAIDPTTGETVWSYDRNAELCSLGQAWSKVVADFRTGEGCGDVVAINASTGQYAGTRSAIASENPVPISSNDRVGIVSDQRVELWRSDLVRTVEYGDVYAKQEANMQPHEDCTIHSALTRKELLGLVEECEGTGWLRFQKATPEDSREPQITADVQLPSADAQIVAIGQKGAAVYVSSPSPQIISFDSSGHQTAAQPVEAAPILQGHEGVFAPATADLPHHMTWFDGTRIYLFNPDTMAIERIFTDAIGTGTALGDRLVIPTVAGMSVANWDTGDIERSFSYDRAGYSGSVGLATASGVIVEKRGTTLVAVQPQ